MLSVSMRLTVKKSDRFPAQRNPQRGNVFILIIFRRRAGRFGFTRVWAADPRMERLVPFFTAPDKCGRVQGLQAIAVSKRINPGVLHERDCEPGARGFGVTSSLETLSRQCVGRPARRGSGGRPQP